MTAATQPHDAHAARAAHIGLDDLARLSLDALETRYRESTAPRVDALAGTPRGRMLTLAGPLGRPPLADLLRRFSASPAFPWHGKSFTPKSDAHGRGVNRIKLLGERFSFETHLGPSVIDGAPCLVLDYALPDNPWFIKQIHDELREVRPGLYLGPAMWKSSKAAPRLMLYFAIEMP
jgi:hypothetical protein